MRVRFAWLAITALITAGCGVSSGASRTVSYGSPHRGVLLHAARLPDRGEGFVRLRPRSKERYGTPSLVRAVQSASALVAEQLPGGPPLRVGDLSSRRGGPQPRHVSHQTGRDADLFYYHRASDRGAELRSAPQFDRYGLAFVRGRAAVFDDARNWHLVRSLLLDAQARVQWIFCSNSIKGRLLRYASRHERSARAIARAAWVLHEPPRVDAHADHFHVRVACSAEERALGCVDGRPRWSWLYDTGGKLESRPRGSLADEALAALLLGEPSRR